MKEKKKYLILSSACLIVGVGAYYLLKQNSQQYNTFLTKKVSVKNNRDIASDLEDEENSLLDPRLAKKNDYFNSVNKKVIHKNKKTIDIKPRVINPKPKSLPKAIVDLQKNQYELQTEYFAIKKDEINPDDFEIVDDKFGYYIIKNPPYTPINSLRIVSVKGSKALAIFTGVIKIKLKNINQLNSLLTDYDYSIEEIYEHINSALIKFDNYYDTMDAHKTLKSSSEVIRADIEILQYQRVSK